MCGAVYCITKSFGLSSLWNQQSLQTFTWTCCSITLYHAQLAEYQPNVVFQQDGAPPHWGKQVREFLNATFPNRWIGRDGPTPWPPRSTNFFLWGHVKDNVYRTPVRDLQSLKARIKSAIESVTFDMLQNTWREIDHRLDDLRATKGAHVEVSWLFVLHDVIKKIKVWEIMIWQIIFSNS